MPAQGGEVGAGLPGIDKLELAYQVSNLRFGRWADVRCCWYAHQDGLVSHVSFAIHRCSERCAGSGMTMDQR